jgi:uncharacterized phage-associated protein
VKFVFDERKAAEAAAQMVGLGGGSMSVLKLIKLLYLADRRSLVETGFPITKDRMVSMPHGLVLSKVLDRIKDKDRVRSQSFDRFISHSGNNRLELAEPAPAVGKLSRYEIRILRETFEQFGHKTEGQLRRYTHSLPEYRDPKGSSTQVDHLEIFKSEGKTQDQIQWRQELAATFAEIDGRRITA